MISINAQQLQHTLDTAHFDKPLVAVYCGAKSGNKPIYKEVAYALGQALSDNGLGLVYGGGSLGMMGAVADGVLSKRGTAVGVIPTFLCQKEQAHTGVTALYISDTMHTRKALMAGLASAFVVLPGGFGTLEEIMEIATWRQLRQHQKPMIIVNIDGFYDNLFAQIRHTIAQGFMNAENLAWLVECKSVGEVIDVLKNGLN